MGEVALKRGEYERAVALLEPRVAYLREIGHPRADVLAPRLVYAREQLADESGLARESQP